MSIIAITYKDIPLKSLILFREPMLCYKKILFNSLMTTKSLVYEMSEDYKVV